jgi:hypothetical protein
MQYYCGTQLKHSNFFSHLVFFLWVNDNSAYIEGSDHSHVQVTIPIASLQHNSLVLLIDNTFESFNGL